MKWRGRRQSKNVEDLRLRALNIYWLTDSSDIRDLTVDTDGSLYMKGDETIITRIAIVPAQAVPSAAKNDYSNWFPTLTTGQKISLQTLLYNLTGLVGTENLTVNPPVSDQDVNLVQYAQSVLNNN